MRISGTFPADRRVNFYHPHLLFRCAAMFTTPEQTPGEQYALAIVLPLLATLFVGLRFLARHLRKNFLLWDDWLTVVALVGL